MKTLLSGRLPLLTSIFNSLILQYTSGNGIIYKLGVQHRTGYGCIGVSITSLIDDCQQYILEIVSMEEVSRRQEKSLE
jgi:hypothetical protein